MDLKKNAFGDNFQRFSSPSEQDTFQRGQKIIFIVGPTAVGKSDVAFLLAQDIGGEIISCDSMQIYKEVSIANNKPSSEIMRKVPHHLVGILSVEEEFDVARYNHLALAAIRDIHQRGRIPIVVGGSGLYVQVILDGIFKGGVKNESLRKDLKDQARQYGNQYLYDKLKEEDPKAAGKIHPNDVRRVVRALEICREEKIPISERQKDREGLWGKYDIRPFALNRDRNALYADINARVEKMVGEGLVEEVETLNHANWSMTAKKIIGVREIQGYLNKEYDLETAKEHMKLNTRRLAKRQLTWFRKEQRLEWFMVGKEDSLKGVAEAIKEDIQQGERQSR